MAEYIQGVSERVKAKKENLKRKIEEKLEIADRPTKKYLFEDSKFFDEAEEQVEEVKSAVASAIKEGIKSGSGSSSSSSFSSSSSSLSKPKSNADIKGKGKVKEVVVEKKAPAKKLGMW